MRVIETKLRGLGAEALTKRMKALLGSERRIQVEFLLHLEELDRCRGYEWFGYATLWEYCQRELGLDHYPTFARTNAVRLIRRFPRSVEFLRDGRLSMTTLVELKDVLGNEEVADRLFAEASWKSKEDVRRVVAGMQARIVAQEATVKKLPPPAIVEAPAAIAELRSKEIAKLQESAAEPDAAATSADEVGSTAPLLLLVEPTRARTEVRPVSADQYRVSMVVGQEFVDTLERAKEALSHVVVNGDLQAVVLRALQDVVTKAGKRNGSVPVRGATKHADASVPNELPASGDVARFTPPREPEDRSNDVIPASGREARLTYSAKRGGLSNDRNSASCNEDRSTHGTVGGRPTARPAAVSNESRLTYARKPEDRPTDLSSASGNEGGSTATGKRGNQTNHEPGASGAGGLKISSGNEPDARRYRLRRGDTRRKPIPADLVRRVFARDGGCCVWKKPDGKICGSRRQLQIDHVDPVAKGGRTELGNLRILCFGHNQQAAREAFGAEFMKKFSRSG